MTPDQGSLGALAELFSRAPSASRAVRRLSPSARVGLELDEGLNVVKGPNEFSFELSSDGALDTPLVTP